jgi:hypothetical protein
MIWPDSIAILVNDRVAVEIQGANSRRRKETIILTENIVQDNYERLVEVTHIKIGVDMLPFCRDPYIQPNRKSLFVVGIYFVEKVEMETFIDKHSKNIEPYKIDFMAKLMILGDNENSDDL